MPNPYISVVVTARNDNHGGDLLKRMQAFVNGWIGQCKRHALDSELIVVDWNPPAERPPLIEALHWPADTSPCEVRFIQVPAELHQRYRHAKHLPLYQMIAKNVGIRRARGEHILVTNIDILFSDELVEHLANRRLEHGKMYRIDRHDAMSDVPETESVDDQLAYCETHLLRVNAREGTFPLTPDGRRCDPGADIAKPEDGIFLGAGWYGPECYVPPEVFRWTCSEAEIIVQVPQDKAATLSIDLEPGPGVYSPLELDVLDSSGGIIAHARVGGRSSIQLQLSKNGERTRTITLRIAGSGKPVEYDTRILYFRVFRVAWDKLTVLRSHESPAKISPLAEFQQMSAAEPAVKTAHNGLSRLLLDWKEAQTFPDWLRATLSFYKRPTWLVGATCPGSDIFQPGSGIYPGRGWYDLEYCHNESFRWVRNDAELIVHGAAGQSSSLVLHVEPGPGLKWSPFDLHVLDDNGATIAKAHVSSVSKVEVPLPAGGEIRAYRLHVEGGDAPCSGDPRLLNFRVFYCSRSGVVSASKIVMEEGLAVGRGWSATGNAFEVKDSGEIFVRHCSGVAHAITMECATPEGTGILVEVEDTNGITVCRGALRGAQTCTFALPLRQGHIEVFFIRPIGGTLQVERLGWSEEPADIVELHSGIRIRDGWPGLDFNCGPMSRLTRPGAEVELRMPSGPQRRLKIDVAPEGTSPATFRVLGETGEVLLTQSIAERQFVEMELPWNRGSSLCYRFDGDPVRLYRLGWSPADDCVSGIGFHRSAPNAAAGLDISDTANLKTGAGWHPVQLTENGEPFRWVSHHAEIALENTEAGSGIVIDIEAGPSLPSNAFNLHLFDAAWNHLCSIPVAGRQEIRVDIPAPASEAKLLRLCVLDPGIPAPYDARILSFRIFRLDYECAGAALCSDPARACSLLVRRVPGSTKLIADGRGPCGSDLDIHLHTNACGDFTMMAREHWFDLRGYPEFDMYSFHIDSILCYAAHHGGAREEMLKSPMRIYHIEHAKGSGWTPEGESSLFDRLRAKGIDWVEYSDLIGWVAQMRKLKSPMIFNLDSWGIGDAELPEMTLTKMPCAAVASQQYNTVSREAPPSASTGALHSKPHFG